MLRSGRLWEKSREALAAPMPGVNLAKSGRLGSVRKIKVLTPTTTLLTRPKYNPCQTVSGALNDQNPVIVCDAIFTEIRVKNGSCLAYLVSKIVSFKVLDEVNLTVVK